jgi:hypothetical protein
LRAWDGPHKNSLNFHKIQLESNKEDYFSTYKNMTEHSTSSMKAHPQETKEKDLVGKRTVVEDSDDASNQDVSTSERSTPYRDFSCDPPTQNRHAPAAIGPPSATAKEPTFPVKLHMILSNPEFQDIISWLPHGRSWRILQQKAFEERVIPLYFRHGRYSSFARQVNGWGFRRITHGSDYNSYYHEVRIATGLHIHSWFREGFTGGFRDSPRNLESRRQ